VLQPGRLSGDYEVSLAELTLTLDLRKLVGTLPTGDRREIFERYGRETGPLNAKGFLVDVDGRPYDLEFRSFDLAVEEHPRYTFHLAARLPERGRLEIKDTNYVASEGISRLAMRRSGAIVVRGYVGPEDVARVPMIPVWQQTDTEERRSKQVALEFEPATGTARVASPVSSAVTLPRPTVRAVGLPSLLDRPSGASLLALWLVALGLGAAHAVQPGHGKTIVAAATIGERGGRFSGILVGLVATVTHTASVLLVAAALWITRSTRYGTINEMLATLAGFGIAAVGVWRLGRHLGGYGEHTTSPDVASLTGTRSLVGLGISGGLVPCWDAILLMMEAEFLGRFALGLFVLSAFSLGMAAVLVSVGWVSADFRQFIAQRDRDGIWQRRAGILSGLILAGIGVFLMAR
jgi:ABC-type nickel/cobalt efflux system permease component RcnA